MAARARIALAGVLVLIVVAALGTVVYLYGGSKPASGQGAQDFVIIASVNGFNGSALSPHSVNGAQQAPWPVIRVAKGTTVNITIYNRDQQAHSFQVAHYFDSDIQTIAPGQKLSVTFVANETGTFTMKCVIPCSIHWAMQDGELVVT